MAMKVVDIPSLTLCEKIADKLITPIMFIIRGFRFDSHQETHSWHPYKIDSTKVDLKMSVENHGDDKSKYNKGGKIHFLFHAPLFGGWKDFSVFEVKQSDTPFYIGWLIYRSKDDELTAAQVHRLAIKNNQIRMLDGTNSSWGYYFALNKDGVQIPLKKIGNGRIGDNTYKNVRLF